MASLTAAQARGARLRSLLLAGHSPASAQDVVAWFGAMQAQDLASALWSLGARLPGALEADMHAALEAGGILRTWPMRGTIHLVPSADAAWMIDLMGGRVLATGARRREQLGLTDDDAERSTRALAEALAGRRRLTRAQALAVINEAGISTEGQRGYHLLWYAAQTGATCIGPQVDGQQSFALLADVAPAPVRLAGREAAAELAFRYFRSHGPTTVQDFAGWTGLPLGVSRTAVADNDGRLVPVEIAGATAWLTPECLDAGRPSSGVLALPGFDELILGYKDRSLHVPEGRMDAVVPGGNGMFRATIVADGVVRGTWTRTLTTSAVKVDVLPFEPLSDTRRAAAERVLRSYARYLGRRLQLTYAGRPAAALPG